MKIAQKLFSAINEHRKRAALYIPADSFYFIGLEYFKTNKRGFTMSAYVEILLKMAIKLLLKLSPYATHINSRS